MRGSKRDRDKVPQFIRRRCPDLSEEQAFEATERVRKYMEIALRIFERQERERLAKMLEQNSAPCEHCGGDKKSAKSSIPDGAEPTSRELQQE